MARKEITICLAAGIGNTVMILPVAQALESIRYKVKFLIHPTAKNLDQVVRGYKSSFGTKTKGLVAIPVLWRACFGTGVSKDQIIAEKPNFTKTHETEANMNMARSLGYKGPIPKPILREVQPNKNDTLVIAAGCHGGQWKKKQYPYWEQLCRKLSEDHKLSFVGIGADSQPWMSEIGEDLCGKMKLGDSIDWVAGAKAVLSIDNGIAHIAGALDKPTNILFGPTLQTKNKPHGALVNIIDKPLPCKPCQLTSRWLRCKEYLCMDIDVESILDRLKLGGE